MRSVNHFREPAAGASRCEFRKQSHARAGLLKAQSCVGGSGGLRNHSQVLIRVLQSGRSSGNPGGTAIGSDLIVPEIHCINGSPGRYFFT